MLNFKTELRCYFVV